MLNSAQAELYQRLQDFELDDPTHEFGFTRHLMKNQGWTLTYAERAIAEYKKFAFLTVVADHQVVPSDQVDQVWHAHVLLTQSYWEEFCPKVLCKNLHHHPARGGRIERAEFHHLYSQTIASYRQYFSSPPTDIWSSPDLRFGSELKMQRINLSEHWVIPKRLPQLSISKPSIVTMMISFVLLGCVNVGQGSSIDRLWSHLAANPFFASLGLSVGFGLALRYAIRMPSKQPQKPQLDNYQIAYLAGFSQRAVDLAITQLVHQGYLRPYVRNRTFSIQKTLPYEATDLEQQVMRQVHRTPDFKSLRYIKNYQTHFLQEYLEQEKLWMTGWAAVIGISFGIFLSIAFLGYFLYWILLGCLLNSQWIQGTTFSHIITYLFLVTFIITGCCFVYHRRTRWGSWILADIEKSHDPYDLAQRFALYGYQTLSGGALDDLKRVFKEQEEEDSGGCGCGC